MVHRKGLSKGNKTTFCHSARSKPRSPKVHKVQNPDNQNSLKRQQPNEIIGLLQWVYEHHQAHIGLRRGDGLEDIEKQVDGIQVFKSSADGIVSIERIGLLGVKIDYSGPGHHGLPEACEIVHGEVTALDGMIAGFVMSHAIAGTTPDWMPGARPLMGPVINPKNGRPLKIWDNKGNDKGTHVEPKLTVDNIKAARRIYHGWWLTLERLAETLTRSGLEVAGPAAEYEPWIINSMLGAMGRAISPHKISNDINHLTFYG